MRLLLLPFSIIYGTITYIKNLLFDLGILKSKSFDIPIICIGNLSIGGTGKTPHTNYLVKILENDYRVAILSRGYGRVSSKFQYVETTNSSNDVGDEPLMLKKNHPNCIVAVDKDRKKGIERLLSDNPDINVILLDDAFQHRWVKAGLNILLTAYNSPYYKDDLLPLGRLREKKRNAERADLVVVTKANKKMNPTEKSGIIDNLSLHIAQRSYFSYLDYQKWYPLFGNSKIKEGNKYSITLVAGIYDASPLITHLKEEGHNVNNIPYKDHHKFNKQDIEYILSKFTKDKSIKKLILTTEKDAVKLLEFKSKFLDTPIYSIPIKIGFSEKERFEKRILDYVKRHQRNS